MNTETRLEEANLRYISTDAKGYTRKRWGHGFTYQDDCGKTIKNKKLREWIESLAIPPAWTDVWISPYKNAHILVTGRDNAGRKQYIYHPDWNDLQKQNKFDDLVRFASVLPILRKTVDQHLRKRKLTREKVLAAVVRLLETTLIRIGNNQYTRQNGTYGLTTLEDDHAIIKDNKVTFEFVGKSGKEHEIMLKDKQLASIIKACQDIPGYELFQYYDEAGKTHIVDSSDVNTYLKEVTGEAITAKIFRTWGGSALAIKLLCEDMADAEVDACVRLCIEGVANALGNTVAVCRDYYVHPKIFEAYENGELCSLYKRLHSSRKKYTLHREEKCLVRLIESE